MVKNEDKLGFKEYVSIALLAIGTKLTDDTSAILYKNLANAAWMTPIIAGFLAIIPIYLLLKTITLYPNKNLLDVIQLLFGKWIANIIVLFLLLHGSSAVIIDSAIYTNIISSMYFTKTPTLVIYVLLMGVCAYGSKKGLVHIGSVAWAVIPYIKISLLLAMILIFFEGQFEFIHPILGPGLGTVFKESTYKVSILGDFLFIGIVASSIKSKKDYQKGTWFAFILVIVEFSIAFLAFILLFDYMNVHNLNYPYHESIRYLTLGFLTNVETFFFPFWLVATFVRFSFYIYLVGTIFGWLFKIQNFEYTIPSLATIFIFVGMIPESPTFTTFNYRETLLNFTTPIFFILPLLLWITAKLKGEFKNASNTNN